MTGWLQPNQNSVKQAKHTVEDFPLIVLSNTNHKNEILPETTRMVAKKKITKMQPRSFNIPPSK